MQLLDQMLIQTVTLASGCMKKGKEDGMVTAIQRQECG